MAESGNKERIQQKAHDLFMTYGIRSVSMDDIANALGISKKTIYHFFADKDELVEAMINKEINENQHCCRIDVNNATNAVDEMFKAMEMVEETFSKMNPSVIFDLRKYHPKAYEIVEQHKNGFVYDIIRNNLQRGIDEELYRAELNIDIIARYRVETMLLPFSPAFYAKSKYTLGQVEQQVIEHYLFGIVSLKGYKLVLKYQQARINKMAKNNENAK